MVGPEGRERPGDLGNALAELWAEQRGTALERVAALEDAVAALAGGGLSDEGRGAARAVAHKLRGSAGTYGFHRASDLAGELEDMLAAGPVDVERTPHVASVVLALRTELEGEPGTGGAKTADESALLIISEDPDFARSVAIAGAAAGGRRTARVAPDEALSAVREDRPALVLLDAPLAGSPDAALGLLSELREVDRELGIVVIAAADDLLDRVEAVRRGARGFVDRALDAGELLAMAEHFASSGPRSGETVIAVDDDPAVLAALRALLEPRGYEYVPVDDPTDFWTRMEECDPDLAIVDLDMPRIDGLDLCRAVRSDPTWGHLPLLILTAYRDPEFVRNAFAAGADDFVTKPIIEEELLARIANRLQRERDSRESTGRDALTNLPTRQRVLTAISEAIRAGGGGAVALIAVRGLEELNRRAGQRAGDDRLRELAARLEQEFPGVGRYGGATFIAHVPPGPDGDLTRAVEDKLDRAAEGRTRLELVAAVVRPERGDLEGSLAAAELALRPRAGARVRVVGATDEPGPDVVVVEDDKSVADVLQLALDTLGVGSTWLADGGEAAAALAGPEPKLRPRAILLDWDLPGLDGLSILRRLAEDGVLESTRVIMLTARAGEQETVKALELGAFDYVPKPFSVPVLVERLRRALDR